MSHQDNSVFVDASGRRGRKVRWAAAGLGVACLGFLAVVVAGSFGAGPAGGPLPWANEEQHDAPALIQPDPAASGDADATPERTAAPRATSGTASGAPATPTAEATTEAPSPTAAATTADAPAATASAPAATTSVKPGKADQAPGATKRPK
ncbi:hypothetical protein [Streptomyces sp. NRRL B-24572]|uniref:hypothetical protein n=1 Tax=Streptomyces sp. NRRL B-24572 TaxID=1962156 RepID=UPI000A37B15F|nr:hypothetical protein [Streptomyces sp. NRRL B-24572]